jgi:putative transposase
VDFTRELAKKTELSERRIVSWLDLARGKYFEWVRRYGKANEHNTLVPRDTRLLPEERRAILDFHGITSPRQG